MVIEIINPLRRVWTAEEKSSSADYIYPEARPANRHRVNQTNKINVQGIYTSNQQQKSRAGQHTNNLIQERNKKAHNITFDG